MYMSRTFISFQIPAFYEKPSSLYGKVFVLLSKGPTLMPKYLSGYVPMSAVYSVSLGGMGGVERAKRVAKN